MKFYDFVANFRIFFFHPFSASGLLRVRHQWWMSWMSLSKFSHRAWEPVLKNKKNVFKIKLHDGTSYSNQIRENVLEIIKNHEL